MRGKHARVGGYAAASVVGLGIGGVLAFMALASGLCNTWGEECSPHENADMTRLWGMALAAPLVVVGIYALLDAIVLTHRRRQGRSGRDGK